MPIAIAAPKISLDIPPRKLLAVAFENFGGILPIKGGWGYNQEDAVIINKNDPIISQDEPFDGVAIEYRFADLRPIVELIILRSENDRFRGIDSERIEQRLISVGAKSYDVLTFNVTALPEKDWNALKAEWEGPNGIKSSDFDKDAHSQKRDSKTICYTATYWFDITSFFGT